MADDGERNLASAGDPFDPAGTGGSAKVAPASVSARLIAAREAHGITAGEIARRTRITIRHIEALEAGDYGALPGRPYAIGFAKAYARAVGLADTEVADAVRLELQGRAPTPAPRVLNQFEVGDSAKTPSRLVSWLALVLVGGILALGGVLWRSYYAPAVSLPALVQEVEQSPPAPRQKPVLPPRPATVQTSANGPVIFTALEEGIWVKFYDGQGKQLMQKQLAKGESYMVPADAIGPRLWTGRPDALSITIGGQFAPRLAEVDKVMKDVPVDATSLLSRVAPPATGTAPDVAPSRP